MTLTDLAGYFGALFIGIVLGLTGGGGSILTVPVLVYLFFINPVTATAYSLFVVGSTSLVGALKNIQKHLVDFKTALFFSIPAFMAVYCTRRFIVPAIPKQLFDIGNFEVTKEIGIMLFFAILMLASALSMIFDKNQVKFSSVKEPGKNYSALVPLGILTGLITGMVGAGGGFIIIPILVLLAKLPMKSAVGTSLLIIAINSLLGFLGDLGNIRIQWIFLLIFTAISILGIIIGIFLGRFINGKNLKKGFGWFVLIMGIYIIWKEINQLILWCSLN